MTAHRIYLVLAGDHTFLIRANTQAQARNHVRKQLEPKIAVSVATQDELIGATKLGIGVQDAADADE